MITLCLQFSIEKLLLEKRKVKRKVLSFVCVKNWKFEVD